MKKIEVTIKPNKLQPVLNALTEAGFNKLTYFEVKGRNQKQGERKMWRGQEYQEIFGTFIQMMLIVQNKNMFNAINIIKNISNDEDNDNIIYITEVKELIMNKQYEKKDKILAYNPGELI